MLLRITALSLLALGALAGCAGSPCDDASCLGPEAPALAPPPAKVSLGVFRARVNPGARTLTFERVDDQAAPGSSPQDLTDLPVVQNDIPGSGPANTVELVTNSVNFGAVCPGGLAASFCGNVTLNQFYGIGLSDVYVQITKVTDVNNVVIAGHGGINNDPAAHGLDASQGLWKYGMVYPGAGVAKDWVLADPDGQTTSIYLRVVGSLYPTLWFNADHTIDQSAPLLAGKPGIIHYDLARLTSCRGAGWTMTSSFFAPNTHNHDLTFPGASSGAALDVAYLVPFGTTQFYFHNVDGGNCSAYDSNGGANYAYQPQAPSPVIHFKPGYTQAVDGALKAGSTVTLDYDLTRLHINNGCVTPDAYDRIPTGQSATAYYAFNGSNSFTGVSLASLPYGVPGTINGQSGQLQAAPTITLPVGTTSLTLYFQGNAGGSPCYDSNLSANYSFTVTP